MAYPDDYKRSYSFTAFQQAQGDNSFPGTQIDNEFDEIHISIDEILEYLALIGRSDGHLTNGLVTWDSLSAELKAKFQAGSAAPGEPVDPALVYAGPPSGPDALPTFRPLAATDLPLLTQSGSPTAVPVSLYARAAGKPQFEDYGQVQKNIAALRNIVPGVDKADILVPDYAGTGMGGGGVFRWNAASTAADDGGLVIQPNDHDTPGRWLRVIDGIGRVHSKWFGAQGDGVTDDTAALQLGIDRAKALGMGYELDIGDYITGPLKLNGSTWQPTDITGGQAAVHCFVGGGRTPFLCRLIAKPGAYDGDLKAVLTGRNISAKTISNLSIDANNIADIAFDFAWIGTSDGNPLSAAPSCSNEFTGLWSYRARQKHFDFRQAADCTVTSCHCEGGTAPIGFDFRLGGGGIWMNTCFSGIDAKLLLASQNAGLQNCGFFGGVEITDESLNYVHFDTIHFYPYTPKRTLAANSLSTTAGQAELEIALGPHGLYVGNYIEISGATDVGGVAAANYINTSYKNPPAVRVNAAPHKIIAKTDTTVTVQMLEADGVTPHLAVSTATGGGTPFITGRGWTIHSNITNLASGSRMLKFTSCYFNSMGPIGQKYFAGRWVGGARFEACRISAPAEGNFSDPTPYFDLDHWAVAGFDGAPPLFKFDGCSFSSTGGRPVSTEGQVLVGIEHRMDNFPSSITEMEWPGDLRFPRSSFDKSRIRFGTTGYMWKDAGDLLRYSSAAPASDGDGRVLLQRQAQGGTPVGVVAPAHLGAQFYDSTNNRIYWSLGALSSAWTEHARLRTGTATPVGATTPTRVGEVFVDTTADKVYIAKDVTSADWIELTAVAGAYQPLDGDLTAIAALTSAADQMPYATGTGTWAMTTVTAAARTVLDDTTVAAMLATLGGMPLAGGNFTGLYTQSGGAGSVIGGSALVAGVYAGGALTPPLQVQNGATGAGFFRSGASASANVILGAKTRGASASAHTAVNVSDQLLAIASAGSDGTAYRDGGRFIFSVAAAPTATLCPSRFDVITNDGTTSFLGVGQDQNGNLQVNNVNVVTQARHIQLRSYTQAQVAALSAATAGQEIYVSDAPSGLHHAVSDGSVWRLDNGQDASLAAINPQTGTTYTLLLTDLARTVEMSNASANTLTVPLNATVAFPIGTRIRVIQTGAGKTTIAATGGVTINSTGGLLSIAAQWSEATLFKRATDTWVLTGALIA